MFVRILIATVGILLAAGAIAAYFGDVKDVEDSVEVARIKAKLGWPNIDSVPPDYPDPRNAPRVDQRAKKRKLGEYRVEHLTYEEYKIIEPHLIELVRERAAQKEAMGDEGRIMPFTSYGPSRRSK